MIPRSDDKRRRPVPVLLLVLVAVAGGVATDAEPQRGSSAGTGAVLVLRGGHRMVVRSYEIDGLLVKITGKDGEAQVMSVDLVDVERSAEATRAHQAEARRLVEEERARAVRERERRAQAAERRANRKGTLLTLDGSGRLTEVEPDSSTASTRRVRKLRKVRKVASGPAGKPSLLVFGATWCGWCKKLNRSLSDSAVRRALADYELRHVDIDREPRLARQHGVRSVPVLVKLDEDGRTIKSHTGYMKPAQLVAWLR